MLNYLADQPEEHGPYDVTGTNWPTWRTYIAMHKDAESLVGAGITAASGEFIDGTQDPNRSGKGRLDSAIYHTDGGYVRIHPGNKIRDDAKPRYFTADEAAGGAAEHAGTEWNTVGPTGLWNWERAQLVPQVDHLNKKGCGGLSSMICHHGITNWTSPTIPSFVGGCGLSIWEIAPEMSLALASRERGSA